jgi:fructuronate reductase
MTTPSDPLHRTDESVAEPAAPPRLALATLAAVRAPTKRFSYDRTRLRPRIVHLGLGAFFRAHGALFTEDVLAEGGDWGIVGASLRRPDQRSRLAPQDFLYTAVAEDNEAPQARIVGCLLDVMVATERPGALLKRLTAPTTAIVTLTVTEKGYCHDPASGRLATDLPEISHDLAHPELPETAVGLIVAALALRRRAGLRPFTVASCDNLPANGRLLRRLVLDFASLCDDALATWIENVVAFPSSMVDRIVPAAAPGDPARVAALTGLRDAAPVMHEPFAQWVLEDAFLDRVRPPWERAGAQLVSDVGPFEDAKLRMLNGSHSALAYLGYLAGHETILDAVSDRSLARFLHRFWHDEVIPVLIAPPGMDLAQYAACLITRYSNPAIRHRTWQIAMDGSQKLPPRLLTTLRASLERGRACPCVMLAVAAWMLYVGGRDLAGREIDVRDPLATLLRRRLDAVGAEPEARVRTLAGVGAVFGDDLPADPRFLAGVTAAYLALTGHGVRGAITRALEGIA